jgi:hypothetical protein
MPTIVSVETNGSLKEMAVKSGELYKKAGFKVAAGFELRTTWNVVCDGKAYEIELYGKVDGRAGQENKYEMPPPVDSVLLFGRCLLVNKLGDLNVAQWKQIYNQLFGGFEDLDEEDEDDNEESDLPMTKSGYAKDGFVVDDADADDDEEYEAPKSKTKAKKPRAKATIKPTKINKAAAAPVQPKETEPELEEEPYL